MDQPGLPTHFVVSCVHRRAYNCTCARRVQITTYPGHTDRPRHKRMYIPAKLQRYTSTRVNPSTRVHYVRRSGYPCKHCTGKYSVRVQASGPSRDRCITQAVHTKCSGYPCQTLYGYKYSVRIQARGPLRDRCITPTVHAKCGAGTSTACEFRHAGTIGTLPRLSMPKNGTCTGSTCEPKHAGLSTISATVRVQVQRASPSTWA